MARHARPAALVKNSRRLLHRSSSRICEALERRVFLAANPYQWPLGPETKVNTYTPSNQYAPATAMDADGNYVIVWDSYGQDGAYGGIYAQRYAASGEPQGPEFRVNTGTSFNEAQPAVAMDPDGDFVVTWTSGLYTYYSYEQYDVRAQRFNAAGEPQGAEFIVNTNTDPAASKFAPSVAMDAVGDFAITWTSNHQDTFYSSVYSQRFSATGLKLGGEVHVNTGSQGEFLPVISMDASGDYVIAWTSYGRDGSGLGVCAQRFDAAGVRQGAEFVVNSYTTGSQGYPAMAMAGDGEFVIAWHSIGQDDFYGDVYAQRYSAAGVSQGAEFRVNASTYGYQTSASAAMDSQGNFVVSWNGNGDDGGGIYARRFDAWGAPLGSSFRVQTVFAGASASTVAMDVDGDFVVAWQSYIHPQDGSYESIHAQRFTTFDAAGAASIGDRVWNDADANGIQDPGEAGLGGVTVELYTADNVRVGAMPTDTAGNYRFVGRAGASAYLILRVPAGFVPTRQDQGANDASDSDINYPTGLVPTFTIGAGGTTNNSIDAGFVSAASVSGVVFNDRNGNGLRDGIEEPMPGFRVFVDFDNDGVRDPDEPASDVDGSGNYSFSNLLAGAYRVIAFDQDLWIETVMPPVPIPPGASTPYNVPLRTSIPDKASTPQGPESRVNSYTTGDQNRASIAMDAGGSFVVVWTGSGSGDDAGIFGQRYSAGGLKQGSEFQINTFTTGSQRDPSAAMDSDGDFVVTWISDGQDGADTGIYAQRFNALGVKQGSESRVNTYTTSSQMSPAAAMNASGDFIIVWQSDSQDGSFWGTYAQRYNAAGAAQGLEFRVNTATIESQAMPAVAMDADGDFVVAWASGYGGYYGAGYDIFAQRFNASGTRQGEEVRVNAITSLNDVTPIVAMDGDGDFVVAWESGVNTYYGLQSDIYAQRYSSAGIAQGTNVRVNTVIGSASAPFAASNPDGDLVITWHGAGIRAQRYNAAGVTQGAELRVNTYTGGTTALATASIAANGDCAIAWYSADQDGSGSGVYAQRYAAVGAANAVTVGDRVWNDANGDGIQDAGESGIAGVTVELYTSDGVFADATLTDSTGHYHFSVLHGASVFLHFVTPAGFIPTRANEGASGSLDSDIDRATGLTPQFTVGAAGSSDLALDAGFVTPASISGVVFNDRSGDGIRNGGEELMAGFEVYLDFDLDGVADPNEPTVTTGGDGSYRFFDLLTDIYSVRLINQDLWNEPAPLQVLLSPSATVSQIYLPVRTSVHDTASHQQGNEFPINSHTIGQQSYPSIAMDADGDYVIVWLSYGQDGSFWGVYGQRYNAASVKQGNEFRVNTYTTGYQNTPSVAMDDAGNFVVAWWGEGSGDTFGVFAQRYSAAGVKQGSQFRVNTATVDNQFGARAAMDSDGDFVITWYTYAPGGSGNDVYAQRYDNAGVPQGAEFRVNTYTSGTQSSPFIAIESNGDFLITWTSFGQHGGGNSVYAQRYSAAGAARGAEFFVGDGSAPSAAISPSGDFIIAWQGAEILARRYNAAAISQGAAVQINTYTSNNQSGAHATIDDNGDYVIFWQSQYQDGSTYGVFGQRYNAAGVRQGAEFQVNTYTSSHQIFPSAVVCPDGDLLVTWTSVYQDGDSYGIYARRYDVAARPAISASEFVWNSGPQRIEFAFDQDVSASLSSADLVLENLTAGTTIPASSIETTWTAATKTVSFTFPTMPNGGSLPDGDYRATLVAAGVSNASGTTLAADQDIQFFTLAGDANRDRVVNITDLGILATSWQQSLRNFSQGDFNYDGVVDIADLGILATNWQKTLSAPGELLTTSPRSSLPVRLPFNLNLAPIRARSSLVEDIDLTASMMN